MHNTYLGNAKDGYRSNNDLINFCYDDKTVENVNEGLNEDELIKFNDVYNINSRVQKYLKAEILDDFPYSNGENEGFLVSGHGIKKRETCGEYKGIRSTVKSTSENVDPLFKTCLSLECPKCAVKASSAKGQHIVSHSRDFINLLYYSGYKDLIRPYHVSFNVMVNPERFPHKEYKKAKNQIFPIMSSNEVNTWDKLKKIENALIKILSHFCIGGVLIPHGTRFEDPDKREKLYFSLHYHGIIFGKLPKSDWFEKEFGFTYRNLSPKGLKSLEDVFRVVRYEFTHSLIYRYQQNRNRRDSDKLRKKYEKYVEDTCEYINNSGFYGYEIPDNYKMLDFDEFRFEKSWRLKNTYRYFGYMTPQKLKIIKEYKTKRLLRCSSLNDGNRQPYREIINGFILRKKINGKTFVYLPDEAREKRVIVDSNMEIFIDEDKKEFGNCYRVYKLMKRIELKKPLKFKKDLIIFEKRRLEKIPYQFKFNKCQKCESFDTYQKKCKKFQNIINCENLKF